MLKNRFYKNILIFLDFLFIFYINTSKSLKNTKKYQFDIFSMQTHLNTDEIQYACNYYQDNIKNKNYLINQMNKKYRLT